LESDASNNTFRKAEVKTRFVPHKWKTGSMQEDDLDKEQSGHRLYQSIMVEDHLSTTDLGKSLINQG